MSILIKSLDMPKNCLECPLQFGGWCYCCPPDIDERVAETPEEAAKGRAEWCTLVEIKGADVVPVVHGQWQFCKAERTYWHECSICGGMIGFYKNIDYKFCPHCGAKMDEIDEEEQDEPEYDRDGRPVIEL